MVGPAGDVTLATVMTATKPDLEQDSALSMLGG